MIYMAWVGEGLLYAAAFISFKDLIRPPKRCLTWLFLLTSLGLLLYAHSTCDFSFLSVVEHTHTHQPLIYRIAAVWGNHEGSLLLWVTQLSLYQFLACRLLPLELRQPVHIILSCLLLIFIVFMLVACNPFMAVLIPPLQGEGLNPVLQDPSLMIHPPCLYAGYTGMAIPFALGLTALSQRQLSPLCRQAIQQWTVIAWTWLTLGLGLGSFWAYYELGWGGWWFWDPVETLSLLPWLAATALLHTLRGPSSEKTTLGLALSGFIFCLMILFFVRSGLLTSIHSFALDAERGLFLFGILSLVTLVVMGVWVKAYRFFESQPFVINFSLRGLLSLQTLCIWVAIASLLLAIVSPLLAESCGQTISINPFYFQATFIPLSLPLLLSMGLAPWVTKKSLTALTTTLGVWLGLFWWAQSIPLFGLIILSIAVWVVISHGFFIINEGLNLKISGMVCAHLGLGVAVVGMVLSTYGTQQVFLTLTEGDTPLPVADTGWHIALKQVHSQPGPNYTARQAVITVYDTQKQIVTTLKPERRYFTASKVIHTEPTFYSTGWSHFYVVLLNDEHPPYRVQVDYKPFINLLWLGIVMMVVGGGLAMIYASCFKRYNRSNAARGVRSSRSRALSSSSTFETQTGTGVKGIFN